MVELNEKALSAGAEALARMYHGESDEPFHHMAKSAISAYLAALPEEVVFCPNCGWNSAMDGKALPAPDDGLEVVATAWRWKCMGERKVDFTGTLDKREIEKGNVTDVEPLVRLSDAQAALQSKDEQIERLTRERDEAQERATANGMSWANALNECEEAEQQAQKLTKENLELMASHNENAKLRGQRDAALALVATFTAENERLRKALLAIATVGLAASDAAYVAAVALETQEGGK